MFVVNDDNSIYATRGDIVFFGVTADDNGKNYKFQPGDVVRIKVFGKKDVETVLLQKDFAVTEITEKVEIYLTEADTKFGEIISKPKDYWYEVELNPDTNPQTIIGYNEDGPAVFKLFPEGDDIPPYVPEPEDIPVVDEELDATSERPVQNRAVAAELLRLRDECERTREAVTALHVTPEMFGAVGDGETDDAEAIQEAINACSAFDTLRFLNKTYCVSEPIVLDKKVNINGNGAILKATQPMDCVLDLTKQGALHPYAITQLKINANKLATDAVRVGDENHATQVTFRECVVRNAVRHGFHVRPVAYIINFVSCLVDENGEDGLHAVAPDSSNQINAINIEKCSFQRNGVSGVHVNGVSLSITEVNSESNKYGITVGGSNYITYGAFITNCHLEQNTIASVYVDTKSGATVSVVRSYFLQANYDEAAGATSFIKCSAASTDITLIVEENTFEGNSALKYVDGGNKLGRLSRIVVDNSGRLENMKLARIETVDGNERFLPIPVSLSSGAGFVDCNTTVNLVGADKKSIKMVVPYDLVNSLVRLVGVYVTTDGTTATLCCIAKAYDVSGTAPLFQTLYDVTLTKTGLYTFNLLNNWGYRRIPNNTFVELEFQLTATGNASSVVLSRPYITAYK